MHFVDAKGILTGSGGYYGMNIGTGAMSDPYMHCEEKLCLTRKCLEIIRDNEFGLAIQTKSDRILRDLDLLEEINSRARLFST
jgi:DNA repair photolyase